MGEFSSEEDDRESLEVIERRARLRARPLRSIVALLTDGRFALLDCGHQKALLVQLQAGDSVRCQDCFDTGMRMARWMIERDCG